MARKPVETVGSRMFLDLRAQKFASSDGLRIEFNSPANAIEFAKALLADAKKAATYQNGFVSLWIDPDDYPNGSIGVVAGSPAGFKHWERSYLKQASDQNVIEGC